MTVKEMATAVPARHAFPRVSKITLEEKAHGYSQLHWIDTDNHPGSLGISFNSTTTTSGAVFRASSPM